MDSPRAEPNDAVALALANIEHRIQDEHTLLVSKIEALDRLIDSRIEAGAVALIAAEQTTRTALEATTIAQKQAVDAAKDALDARLRSGDEQLLIHIEAQQESVKTALSALDRLLLEKDKAADELAGELRNAQSKFEETTRENFKNANNFRATQSDLIATMATRRELEQSSTAQSEKADELSKQIQNLRSRLDVGPQGLAALQSRADLGQGRQEGLTTSGKVIASAVGVVGTFLGIIIILANLFTGH